jgi:DNA-binding CsgD family transcriptional regulator
VPEGASVNAYSHKLPDEVGRRYLSYYHKVNPWLAPAMARGLAAKATRGDDIVPELVFKSSEFFTDFARGYDTVEIIGCGIVVAGGTIAEIGMHRGARTRHFDARNVGRVQRLVPHIQRALQLRRRLGTFAASRAGLDALDALAVGAVICDAAGTIRFANAAAKDCARLGDGVILGGAGHGIVALHRGESAELARLIAEAAGGAAGGALSITGGDGRRLLVLVSPLPLRFAEGPGKVLVTMRPADAAPNVDPGALSRLFGLTPAEARLALALLAGRSLAEFGASRNVTENTLRTQLGGILRKTDTTGQRDLVRLLSLLPPLR